jgi:penicillin-binding protein 1A
MMGKKRTAGGCLRGLLIFAGITIALIGGLAAITGFIYINSLPTLEELTPSPIAQTSKVYDIDGNLITEFHAGENREIIDFSQMSQNIRDAVVAIEDKRFYEHQGVDYIRIIGAAIADIRARDLAQGASTITQQVVKNIYFSPEKTWRRKINEALVAIQLERNFTKDRILEIYLNTIYFGAGTYGIEKASEIYLGKDASSLSIPEAAMLAGMIQAPEIYSPFNDIESARYRRDHVLRMMYEQEMISSEDYMKALAEPIIVNEGRTAVGDTGTTGRMAPYFIDYVKTQLYDQMFSDYDVFKGGLRIYTTLDMDLQSKAEQSVSTVFPEDIEPSYSLLCSDPDNGYIYALIGGKDYEKSKFNIATQGRRQPGSVFKTVVLMEAVRQNISAKNEFAPNGPITIDMPEGPDWEVNNYGGQSFEGDLSIADATVYSVNVVYAQLMMRLGAENVESLCSQMEIYDIGSNPAIALGGLEVGVTPLEVGKIFSTLASGGIYRRPVTILKITDAEGNILFQHDPEGEGASSRILDEPVAAYITRILRKVIETGTGRGADIGRPAAGKTGTTSDYKDAWFAGYTPDLVTIVWMGNSESSEPMEPINGRVLVGGTYPADIWRQFMSLALEGIAAADFPDPGNGLTDFRVCSESGLKPVFWCPEELLEWKIFEKGKEPDEICDIHNKVEVPDLTGLDIQEARGMLEEMFIEATEVDEYNDTFNRGKIFDQSPPPGSILESLTGEKLSMILYVSRGEETFEMPVLTGFKLGNAEKILSALDVEIDEVIYEFSDLQPEDYIFDQKPAADTLITRSTKVKIFISKGEDPQGELPDVTGMTEEEALAALSLSGFDKVTIVLEESSEEIGLVFSQAPESGTVYDKASEVVLIVSKGLEVPDVTGLSLAKAFDLLKDLGFIVATVPQDAGEGKVTGQSPAGGEYAGSGTQIILTIEDKEDSEGPAGD